MPKGRLSASAIKDEKVRIREQLAALEEAAAAIASANLGDTLEPAEVIQYLIASVPTSADDAATMLLNIMSGNGKYLRPTSTVAVVERIAAEVTGAIRSARRHKEDTVGGVLAETLSDTVREWTTKARAGLE